MRLHLFAEDGIDGRGDLRRAFGSLNELRGWLADDPYSGGHDRYALVAEVGEHLETVAIAQPSVRAEFWRNPNGVRDPIAAAVRTRVWTVAPTPVGRTAGLR